MMALRGISSLVLPSSGRPDDRDDHADNDAQTVESRAPASPKGTARVDARKQQHAVEIRLPHDADVK